MSLRVRLVAANNASAGAAVLKPSRPVARAKPARFAKVRRLKPHELTFIFRNLATLVGNGVPLPKALATLAEEDTLSRHRSVLDAVRTQVETGVPFSTAIVECNDLCDRITAAQVRIGERAGALAETLERIATARDKADQLRAQVIKKMAYPLLLMVLGSGLIVFLLTYVVPVFEKTYAEAHVPLPFITQALIAVGDLARQHGLAVGVVLAVAVLAAKRMRKNERIAARMDMTLLRAPFIGRWARDIAVLQMMTALNNLMNAGFTVAEALRQTTGSIGNRAVRSGVRELQAAVERGERFSREIERLHELFPPIVYQLATVGESTGQLAKATTDICEHLRREIERKTTLMVGALEPALTISLAASIAIILLAIYLPMFDMVSTIAK